MCQWFNDLSCAKLKKLASENITIYNSPSCTKIDISTSPRFDNSTPLEDIIITVLCQKSPQNLTSIVLVCPIGAQVTTGQSEQTSINLSSSFYMNLL